MAGSSSRATGALPSAPRSSAGSEEFPEAFEGALAWGVEVLAEACIEGVEVAAGVVEEPDGTLLALPPVEIRPRTGGFFDYSEKYSESGAEELCPPENVDENTCARVGAIAPGGAPRLALLGLFAHRLDRSERRNRTRLPGDQHAAGDDSALAPTARCGRGGDRLSHSLPVDRRRRPARGAFLTAAPDRRGPEARVVVIGARGRMGRFALDYLADDPRFDVVARLSRGDDVEAALRALGEDRQSPCIGLDFTQAGLGLRHAMWMLAAGVHPVIGTSGVRPGRRSDARRRRTRARPRRGGRAELQPRNVSPATRRARRGRAPGGGRDHRAAPCSKEGTRLPRARCRPRA